MPVAYRKFLYLDFALKQVCYCFVNFQISRDRDFPQNQNKNKKHFVLTKKKQILEAKCRDQDQVQDLPPDLHLGQLPCYQQL